MKKKLIKYSKLYLKIAIIMGLLVSCVGNMVVVDAHPVNPDWDGAAAAAYAKQYAIHYNKDFDSWDSDCTNFASQCVKAGLKPMDSTDEKPQKGGKINETSSKWYYKIGKGNKYVTTTSWVRCSGKHAFANYWDKYKVGAYKKLENVYSHASLGDVIQITLKDGTLKHSIVVTEVNRKTKTLKCSSHTKDYYNDSLDEIAKRAKKDWGEVKFTVFHFYSTY